MKISRNDPCPCGSGKKFKHCCGGLVGAGAGPKADRVVAVPNVSGRLQMAFQHHAGGRLAAAERGYRQVVAHQPDNFDALHALGVLQSQTGRFVEAAQTLEKAMSLSPSFAEAHFNLGAAFDGQGRLDEAMECYRKAAELNPNHADAIYNLAVALEKTGRQDAAIEHYRRVLRIEPESVDALTNVGGLLAGKGRLSEAIECYERALTAAPAFPAGYGSLANALRLAGRSEDVVTCYRRALALMPENGELHSKLGTALVEAGRPEEALKPYRRGLELRHRPGAKTPDPAPIFAKSTRAKLQHDLEQLNYLLDRGLLPRDSRQWIADVERALQALGPVSAKTALADLPPDVARRLAPFYNRLVNYSDAPTVPGGAVNPHLDRAAVESEYFRNAPGIAYIDNFLTPAALEGLRRLCLESTIWYDFAYNNGYVGAMMNDGFFCPLLLQIAQEFRQVLPGIFANHQLAQMWAYKYDSELSGIEMHADFAAVNVNFWITPDQANLRPGTGGLVIWDKEAPRDWDFDAYNRKPELIREFLDRSGANKFVVPYRQNRVVVFNSDLFHRTDDIHFREGYENRRINITFLYGRREDA